MDDSQIPNWVAPHEVKDYLARKKGYRSDYQMRFGEAIKAHMAGDSSLLDAFENNDAILQAMRSGSLRYGGFKQTRNSH